jgi:hypothetical protein
MNMNGTMGKNKFKHLRGPLRSWLLAGGLALGTVKDASGNLEVTYNHWPLYTFSGDSGPGVAKGQALTSLGGTWYVLNGSGNPVTSSQSGNASSGGGYGY